MCIQKDNEVTIYPINSLFSLSQHLVREKVNNILPLFCFRIETGKISAKLVGPAGKLQECKIVKHDMTCQHFTGNH